MTILNLVYYYTSFKRKPATPIFKGSLRDILTVPIVALWKQLIARSDGFISVTITKLLGISDAFIVLNPIKTKDR